MINMIIMIVIITMVIHQGAGKGLLFFFTPQWEKLASLKVKIMEMIMMMMMMIMITMMVMMIIMIVMIVVIIRMMIWIRQS